MKTKKLLAALLASTMTASALASLSVSAETAIPGDVDLDGIVTGHDAAMVSRYLDGDTDLLTADQLAIADMDGNGTVDQADADLIFEAADYHLGDIFLENESSLSITSVRLTLYCWSYQNAGIEIEIVDTDTTKPFTEDTLTKLHQIDQLTYNLMDVDGNGILEFHDSYVGIMAYATTILKPDPFIYLEEGCYYMDATYLASGATGIDVSYPRLR